MMRGSVVFLAVLAVSSYATGANGAHFIKSGIRGDGTGRGNGDAQGIGDRDFGNGESDGLGHYLGKRSLLGLNLAGSLGHDIAKLAGFRSAAARRQQMISPNAQFPRPVPSPPPVRALRPGMTPPIFTKPWPYPIRMESYDLPLKRAVPSALHASGEMQPLPTLKFLPLSDVKEKAMKIISNLLPVSRILPGTLPKPLARSSLARSLNFYRSGLKNRRSRYSGLRSSSALRSYPSPPGLPADDIIIPLYKHVRNVAPALPGTDLNFRGDVRSIIIEYLVQLWNKIKKWLKPGSVSGTGVEDLFPGGVIPEVGEIPIEHLPEGDDIHIEHLPGEDDIHTEHVPGEDDIHMEHVPGEDDIHMEHLPGEDDIHTEHIPGEDDIHMEHLPGEDDIQIDHLPTDEDAHEKHLPAEEDVPAIGGSPDALEDVNLGGYSAGEGETDDNEDYYKPIHSKPAHYKPVHHTNWEARYATGIDDGLGYVDEDYLTPIRSRSVYYSPVHHSNWEARYATGMEDVAGMTRGTPAATRRKYLRDDLETVTNIFGRLADD